MPKSDHQMSKSYLVGSSYLDTRQFITSFAISSIRGYSVLPVLITIRFCVIVGAGACKPPNAGWVAFPGLFFILSFLDFDFGGERIAVIALTPGVETKETLERVLLTKSRPTEELCATATLSSSIMLIWLETLMFSTSSSSSRLDSVFLIIGVLLL